MHTCVLTHTHTHTYSAVCMQSVQELSSPVYKFFCQLKIYPSLQKHQVSVVSEIRVNEVIKIF